MEILNMEQGSEEWFYERLGSLGGSEIGDATAGGAGKTKMTLMYGKIREIVTGTPYERKFPYHVRILLDRGKELEPFARDAYREKTGIEIEEVGLCRKQLFKHHSPDGLEVDDGEGMIEIKCPEIETHIRYLNEQNGHSGYAKQIQWGLWNCERQWCDFVSYCPEFLPNRLWLKRVDRDEKLIKELDQGADRFLEEMLTIIERITKEV